MTTLPQDLVSYITGTTAVTDLVGGSSAPRVHYSQVPQSSPPSWVWMRVTSDTQQFTMDEAAGIREAFVDVEAVADTQADAQAIADALTTRLDGYRGAVGNAKVRGMWLSDKDDDYVPKSVINADVGRSVVAFDMRLFYST